MKNLKKFLACTILIAICMMSSVFATNGENIMMFGEDVEATGIANGLVMLAGGKVKTVADGDYAFVAGQEVDLAGNISKDAFIFSEKFLVEQSGIVNRDVFVCASKVTIEGAINRNLYVFASEIYVSEGASIRGNIFANAGTINIDENSSILGTVQYNSDAKVSIPENVQVDVIQVEDEVVEEKESDIVRVIKGIISSIVLFALLSLIATAAFDKINRKCDEHKFKIGLAILIGVLELILVPLLSILLMFSRYTIVFAFVLLLAFIIICFIAEVITAYLVGKLVFKNVMNAHLSALIFIVLFRLASIIPVLYVILYLVELILALGTVTILLTKDKKTSEKSLTNTDENSNNEESNEVENNETQNNETENNEDENKGE